MKRLSTLFLVLVAIIGLSCEPRNPFGPTYDLEGNLARDGKIIDEFLKTAQIDSIRRIHDQNGVIIIVQEEGTGSKPGEFRLIYTNYIGRLLDGTVFDTNLESVAKANDVWDENRIYRTFQFTLGSGEAIQGFNIGFRQLRSGSKAVLIIPSPWAYRDQERDGIPANSILMFEVEFLGIE
ncbi:FKBP-type peptidyl-prolyl cis-trans isomerase [Cecembia rubra]|uniref:Peptidyl-prolyl cis-trans isomerase n=1 Tax=Cecembia rubra TaxID=1485585 RepID=A0A2P8E236_9BACT|nr:FKBP-type peptidyl-prolyl cis-trans isomerase [Cecembia rubra]PSL03477.1 FKBP-type peptidyl-prolyl cis-trans isomerase FkpA [Cecembia rubra]